MTKTECQFYRAPTEYKGREECTALTHMYCWYGDCKYYTPNRILQAEIMTKRHKKAKQQKTLLERGVNNDI